MHWRYGTGNRLIIRNKNRIAKKSGSEKCVCAAETGRNSTANGDNSALFALGTISAAAKLHACLRLYRGALRALPYSAARSPQRCGAFAWWR
jgi:hypothetical protein